LQPSHCQVLFTVTVRRSPISTLFPYTTLFRSGRGKKDGSLYEVKPVTLLSGLLRELQQRNQLDTAQVDDVVMGCVTPIGDQGARSEEHTSDSSHVKSSYAVFCLKKKKNKRRTI